MSELTPQRMEQLKKVALVYLALEKGNIINAGGILMVADRTFLKGTHPADMRWIIEDLAKIMNVRVERKDSGGTPTWGIAE